MTLDNIREIAIPACEKFDVKRLDVFDSFARAEGTEASDIDFPVEFDRPDIKPSKRFFGLLHQLENEFHCKIDIVTFNGLRNPYLRERIFKERGQHLPVPCPFSESIRLPTG